MKAPNRDLLVLMKDEFRSQASMEYEVEQLNRMLYHYETMEIFCRAHEVFDLNRFKVINKPAKIFQICQSRELKPFVFVCNKN